MFAVVHHREISFSQTNGENATANYSQVDIPLDVCLTVLEVGYVEVEVAETWTTEKKGTELPAIKKICGDTCEILRRHNGEEGVTLPWCSFDEHE